MRSKHKLITMPSPEVQAMIPKIQAYLATQPVERAYLFGSCARGDERPDSDVDLLFTVSPKVRFSLLDHGGMYSDLTEILGKDIDLVREGTLLPFAVESANRDKILIYERTY